MQILFKYIKRKIKYNKRVTRTNNCLAPSQFPLDPTEQGCQIYFLPRGQISSRKSQNVTHCILNSRLCECVTLVVSTKVILLLCSTKYEKTGWGSHNTLFHNSHFIKYVEQV